jgi:hypothetical protein
MQCTGSNRASYIHLFITFYCWKCYNKHQVELFEIKCLAFYCYAVVAFYYSILSVDANNFIYIEGRNKVYCKKNNIRMIILMNCIPKGGCLYYGNYV